MIIRKFYFQMTSNYLKFIVANLDFKCYDHVDLSHTQNPLLVHIPLFETKHYIICSITLT
jgi:hypothetical protein